MTAARTAATIGATPTVANATGASETAANTMAEITGMEAR